MKTMQCKDIWNFTNSSHFPNILCPIWIFATVSILQYFVSNEKKMPLPCLRHFQYHTEKRKIDMRAMLMGGIGIEFVERIIWLWTDFLKHGGRGGWKGQLDRNSIKLWNMKENSFSTRRRINFSDQRQINVGCLGQNMQIKAKCQISGQN